MPVARFEMPDGKVARFEVPEGTTPEQAQEMIGKAFPNLVANKASKSAQDTAAWAEQIRAEGGRASDVENFAAGAGKAMTDIARGTGQIARSGLETVGGKKLSDLLGLPTKADIAESRARDEPLMATKAGLAGNITGNIATFLPASIIPGANTLVGSALVGGTMGAVQPTVEGESRLKNTAIGGAFGATTKLAVQGIGKGISKISESFRKSGTAAQVQNATRDAALMAGREAGYVVSPAQINPTLTNQLIESTGGKISTAQSMSIKNQAVTDKLAKQYLGIADDTPLTKQVLKDAKDVASQPYKQIAKISGKAAQLLDDWKQGNFDAKMQWRYFRRSGNPEAYAAAREAEKAAAKALDGIEQEATTALPGADAQTFISALKDARVKLGKIMSVESSLTSGGHVDAKMIAKVAERSPISGELKTIADFASNFPKAVQLPEKIGGTADQLKPWMGAALGGLIGGGPGTVAGGALGVAGPWTVRKAMMSGAGQRMLATPSYSSGAIPGTVAYLLQNPVSQRALPLISAAAAVNYRPKE